MPDPEWEEVQVPARFSPGQDVFSGATRGRVSVVTDRTFTVIWSDGNGDAVVYPIEYENIRAAYPWE